MCVCISSALCQTCISSSSLTTTTNRTDRDRRPSITTTITHNNYHSQPVPMLPPSHNSSVAPTTLIKSSSLSHSPAHTTHTLADTESVRADARLSILQGHSQALSILQGHSQALSILQGHSQALYSQLQACLCMSSGLCRCVYRSTRKEASCAAPSTLSTNTPSPRTRSRCGWRVQAQR
jgi:hypothetical protein